MIMCYNWYVMIVLHPLEQCKRWLFLLIQILTFTKNRFSQRRILRADTERSLFLVSNLGREWRPLFQRNLFLASGFWQRNSTKIQILLHTNHAPCHCLCSSPSLLSAAAAATQFCFHCSTPLLLLSDATTNWSHCCCSKPLRVLKASMAVCWCCCYLKPLWLLEGFCR